MEEQLADQFPLNTEYTYQLLNFLSTYIYYFKIINGFIVQLIHTIHRLVKIHLGQMRCILQWSGGLQ